MDDHTRTARVPPDRDREVAGRYRLLSPLGQGGMGTVWRALDENLQREVAVKEVRTPAGLRTADIEKMYTRLEREAWAAARIPHRNVVMVHDVVTDDGRPWIVMELVRGRSLADLLREEGPLAPGRAAAIGAEVLAALRAAHGVGVLHRDVKPANVLVADDGRVILTDFGIATVEGDTSLTVTGEVVGSPEYLPPERALGRTPGPESDLWSLGVLLHAAVEGVSPFRRDTPLGTLRAIVDEEPPPSRRGGPLVPVVEGLLRKEPAERMTGDRAERLLRGIAAGDAPDDGAGTGAGTGVVIGAVTGADAPTTTGAVTGAVTAPGTSTGAVTGAGSVAPPATGADTPTTTGTVTGAASGAPTTTGPGAGSGPGAPEPPAPAPAAHPHAGTGSAPRT
ncbi:serine/threonine-protein kinase, partial [Streptomyces alkaliphilus]|uniref:serine/threonine-protein kinase n=1 Tax=Streptomyces alkaliphilus TaxID=1472722 RepID=UPI00118111AF